MDQTWLSRRVQRTLGHKSETDIKDALYHYRHLPNTDRVSTRTIHPVSAGEIPPAHECGVRVRGELSEGAESSYTTIGKDVKA